MSESTGPPNSLGVCPSRFANGRHHVLESGGTPVCLAGQPIGCNIGRQQQSTGSSKRSSAPLDEEEILRLLDELSVHATNPRRLIELFLREPYNHIPIPLRTANLWDAFVGEAAQLSQQDKDYLVTQGARTFGCSVETIRQAIQGYGSQGDTRVEIVPSLLGEDFIADVAFEPEKRTTFFLRYNLTDRTVEMVTEFDIHGVKYRPSRSLSAAHVKARGRKDAMVLLPTAATVYGTALDLAQRVEKFLVKWVVFPDDKISLQVVKVYVFASYLIESYEAVPYVRALGEWGSGKTRLITVAGSICQRPTFLAGATTPAPIYHLMDQWRGTLVMDEADFSVRNEVSELMEKIQLQGYKRGWPVPRMGEGPDGEMDTIPFDVFGMKLTSNRRSYEAALDSRHITIPMSVLDEEHQPDSAQLPAEFWDEALALRNQLQLWRFHTLSTARLDVREKIPGVIGRTREVGLSLLLPVRAITGVTGSEWEQKIIESLKDMSEAAKENRSDSWEGTVASAYLNRWEAHGVTANVATTDIRNLIINPDAGHEPVKELAAEFTQRRVNRILRWSLHLKLFKSNGRQYTRPITRQKAENLARTYGYKLKPAPNSDSAESR